MRLSTKGLTEVFRFVWVEPDLLDIVPLVFHVYLHQCVLLFVFIFHLIQIRLLPSEFLQKELFCYVSIEASAGHQTALILWRLLYNASIFVKTTCLFGPVFVEGPWNTVALALNLAQELVCLTFNEVVNQTLFL